MYKARTSATLSCVNDTSVKAPWKTSVVFLKFASALSDEKGTLISPKGEREAKGQLLCTLVAAGEAFTHRVKPRVVTGVSLMTGAQYRWQVLGMILSGLAGVGLVGPLADLSMVLPLSKWGASSSSM